MTFVLPLLSGIVLFGSTFDLRRYELTPYQIYSQNDSFISNYSQITNISNYEAEFSVIDSSIEFRKFLDLDVTTGLKAIVEDFPYAYRQHLSSSWHAEDYHVKIAVKFRMRTVKETLPYDSPTLQYWKEQLPQSIGSHYVKSILYGGDSFAILNIIGRGEEHRNRIRASVACKLGEDGIFDSSFKEKFDTVLREHGTGYMMSSFGTLPSTEYIPPSDIDDLLSINNNIQEIVETGNNGKGFIGMFEMQSLSFVDTRFPLVEINSEIIEALKEVELKYMDLKLAYGEYFSWVINIDIGLTSEATKKIEEFDLAINAAKEAMELAINNVDITTTSGRTDQFEDAMNTYGERNSTDKYRLWVKQLKENIQV